jgi:CRP-like cAMP-binding protein
MQTIDQILDESRFFHGLSHDALELIAGCGSNVHFDDGEMLFREGGEADHFYLVRHGTVAIECFAPTVGALTLDTVEEGEILGWSWLFPPYRWQFDARAVGIVRATQFDGLCLRGKCETDRALGYDLMLRFSSLLLKRLQWTRMRLVDMYVGG